MFITKLPKSEVIKNRSIHGVTDPKELYGIFYPYEKAICQALLLPVPKIDIEEISYKELQKIESERGVGMLGSSNK